VFKDYQVVQTLTLYVGVVVVVLNLAVDVTYAWLDPRIRYS
jgi:ABC-type dipeptide/oligopeptide/nickel transport system permease component